MRSKIVLALAILVAPAAAVRADLPDLNTTWFRPATGGDGLAATEGARPLHAQDGALELRIWGVGEKDPIVPGNNTGTAAVFNRFIGWASLQLRVSDATSIFFQVPGVLNQHGTLAAGYPFFRPGQLPTGPSDPILGFRTAVLRQENQGFNLVLKANAILPLGKAGSFAADRTGRLGIEGLAAVSRIFGDVDARFFELLGNVFVRNHDKMDLGLTKFGSTELGVRAGWAFYPGGTNFRRFFAEIDTQSSFRDFFASGNTPMVVRGGVTVCFTKEISFDAIVGKGLSSDAIGTPDLQFIGAFGWSPSTCQPSSAGAAAKLAAEEKAAAEKAAAEKAVADKAAAERAAADKAADEKAAADKAAAEKVAAEKAASDKSAADAKAAADKAAAEAVATKDADGDGVPDTIDNCPREAGPKENMGCPISRRQKVALREGGKIEILEKVQFAPGKAVAIGRLSFGVLDQVVSVAKAHPEILLIEVQGHADYAGKPKQVEALSKARAAAVAEYLVRKGIEKPRIAVVQILP